jgi:DNA-binding transcriptional LysR family regulator
MNFSQIKCFLAAADCLSFTKAADRLYLSQPVLSRQIASMEDELGMELFVREKKSVRLTPAGEVLSEGLRQLANDYQALLDRANAMHMGYSGNVIWGWWRDSRSARPFRTFSCGFMKNIRISGCGCPTTPWRG